MAFLFRCATQALLIASFVGGFSSISKASLEGDSIHQLLQNNGYLKVGTQAFETSVLETIYATSSYEPIWIKDGQMTPMGEALKNVFLSADRHGLSPNAYWTPLMEKFSRDLKAPSWISLELACSDALVRYARNLQTGQLDPQSIDDDIKFERKTLDVKAVAALLSRKPEQLAEGLDLFAPQNSQYARLQQALAKWKEINQTEISEADQDRSNLSVIKHRLKILGYAISEEGETNTPELQNALKIFAANSGVEISKEKIGPKSPVIRHLMASPKAQQLQIELSMEKLRWLPTRLESRHAFVNLAFQQLRLYDQDQLRLQMKTINGRPTRRTPSMRDAIHTVEFNPSWSVPLSIALRDKLPMIKRDLSYFDRAHFRVYDQRLGREVEPSRVDWSDVDKGNFNYELKQAPGPGNALGLVKFHLRNPWAIYLHDTNERQLFPKNDRLLSSGCIRLEKPMDLALYLLKDKSQWSSAESIEAVFPHGKKPARDNEIRVSVTNPIPVYTLFQTVEVGDDGIVRFADDAYGQDSRLLSILSGSTKVIGAGPVQGMGALQVNGVAGPSQIFARVNAIRCEALKRGACDASVSFGLNKARALPAGYYIVGFENSIRAGWVKVEEGATTQLDLIQTKLPEAFKNDDDVKVFRDLSSSVEQQKFLWAVFHLGHQPFSLSNEPFGDLYIAEGTRADTVTGRTPAECLRLKDDPLSTPEAKEVCQKILNAKSFQDLSSVYEFRSDATVLERWVSFPGDRFKVIYKRHLVAAPLRGGDFVSVFPGVYRAVSEKQSRAVTFRAGQGPDAR